MDSLLVVPESLKRRSLHSLFLLSRDPGITAMSRNSAPPRAVLGFLELFLISYIDFNIARTAQNYLKLFTEDYTCSELARPVKKVSDNLPHSELLGVARNCSELLGTARNCS